MGKRSKFDKISIGILFIIVLGLKLISPIFGPLLNLIVKYNLDVYIAMYTAFSVVYFFWSFVIDDKFNKLSADINIEIKKIQDTIYGMMLKDEGLHLISELNVIESDLYNFFGIKEKDKSNTYFKIYVFTNSISVEKDFAETVWNNMLKHNFQYCYISNSAESTLKDELKKNIKSEKENKTLMDFVLNHNLHFIQDEACFALTPKGYTDIVIYEKMSTITGYNKEFKGFFCYQNGPIKNDYSSENYYYRELTPKDAEEMSKHFEILGRNKKIEIDSIKSTIISPDKVELRDNESCLIAKKTIKAGEDLIKIGGKFLERKNAKSILRDVYKIKISKDSKYYLCGYEECRGDKTDMLYYCVDNESPNCSYKIKNNVIVVRSNREIKKGEHISISYENFGIKK